MRYQFRVQIKGTITVLEYCETLEYAKHCLRYWENRNDKKSYEIAEFSNGTYISISI
jgi:hypothetical protein